MKDEQRIKLLTSKRQYAFKDIQILFDLSKTLKVDNSKLNQFKARYARIESLRQEYILLTDEINSLKLTIKPDTDIDTQAVAAFDDLYYAVVDAYSMISVPELSSNTPNTSNSSKPIGQARLPKIELPKFDGDIEGWQTFYDTFTCLVHDNSNISYIEKFHYLLSCLSGSALSIAKGVPVTCDNYQVVFNALVDRFENKRILSVNYLDKICNYPSLKSGNLNELRKFTSILNESVNALKAINIENLGEYILFYLASRTLDPDTRKRFETQNNSQIPTFHELLSFLQNYVKVLEASESGHSFQYSNKSVQKKASFIPNTRFRKSNDFNNKYKSSSFTVNTKSYSSSDKVENCVYCSLPHSVYKCAAFKALDYSFKNKFVTNNNICRNCLRKNHNIDSCFSKSRCLSCGARHHTLLHSPAPSNSTESGSGINVITTAVPSVETDAPSTSTVCASTLIDTGRAVVLLGTCSIRIQHPGNASQSLVVRALIDSGAQDCFLSVKCAKRLGLPLRRCNVAVAGLGQNIVHQVHGVTSCTILPRDSNAPSFNICPIVMTNITNQMPTAQVPLVVRESYKHLFLADSEFDKPADVDLLIGAELFHSIYDGQRLEAGPGLPVALHSVFGWVITGKLDNEDCRPPQTVSSLLASTFALDEVVKRFWQVEEPPLVSVLNPDDTKCEQIYSELVYQNPDGQYVVPILLKEPYSDLGESHTHSLSRLKNLEKRLSRDDKLKEDYSQFMREYETLGHMQPIESSSSSGKYIIPHHCVLRPESTTTKLRVVFDASAKTTNGKSLNDIVHTGPKLQNDIVDIITKFRFPAIVFTADISKMYRHIGLRPEDRCWQHVLWRESPNDPLTEFELNTVTYGVSSSPFLAIRTLHQLAQDHGSERPRAAQILLHDTFMDDITAGRPTVRAALELKDELLELLSCARFELRKWSSNSKEFLSQIPSEYCQIPKEFCDDQNQRTLKILGIQWDPDQDIFTYSISQLNSNCTKRAILSNVARIYDPLGWLTPVVLQAKLILQTLWRYQLNWDESVPSDVAQDWQDFVTELNNIKEVRLPRRVSNSNATHFELVGFCDGSTKAYGCCVYLRALGDKSNSVHLLIAKSKVAPLKPLTVNRLELCGAVLLSRILKHMWNLLHCHINLTRMVAFTDSKTVLSWLNTEAHRLKTFVSHRVVKINDNVSVENWHHVSTHDNPADHCSRGLSCSQLVCSPSWWSGPKWLAEDTSAWPINRTIESLESVPELKSVRVSHVVSDHTNTDVLSNLLEKYSSLSRTQRVLAWCFRFIHNLRQNSTSRMKSNLTASELERSINTLIRHVQATSFPNEISAIRLNQNCSRSIQKLKPFVDEAGLLRVGGRLKNANLSQSATHPFLLPKDSPLSKLLIDYHHLLYLHCGPRTLQSLVQRRYWILGIRNLIRSRLSKCVPCFKAKPKIPQPLMGDLPPARVQPSRCFQNVGIDFAGPFMVKESRRRNARTYKAYVCIIVCLAVKAIHIELVTELSTPAFLAALDRFVSRRGLCESILTDNGTNFVGAKHYFDELSNFFRTQNLDIESNLAKRNIIWKFNPPTGSHFGGIFESGVKSMKSHLKRVMGTQVLTFEELSTILTKIEAVLNSRPLCVISADPQEADILTPGHFLAGGPLVSLPEPDLSNAYVSPMARWNMLKKLTQCFWQAWQRDYLHTLQQRSKWIVNSDNVQIGNVVLIVDQHLPSLEWRYGRIETVHPGTDGVVRVVTLRTANGLLRRPVAKICPLPIQN